MEVEIRMQKEPYDKRACWSGPPILQPIKSKSAKLLKSHLTLKQIKLESSTKSRIKE